MARVSQEIILGGKAWLSGRDNPLPTLDPLFGGQFGWATNPGEWLSAQSYIPRNLIPIVVEAPQFFKLMPDPGKWVEAWRVFIEKHARTIEGLKAGLTVDVAEHHFGGAGEMFQEYVDVKRERSTLSIGMVDKYGNVWQNFLERWIIYAMMHPETKVPMTATLAAGGPPDNLADWYGGTVAFIQPDPTGKRVERTWITTNIWPHGTGPIEGKLDKTSSLAIKELSIEMSALSFLNDGTRALGQELLNAITHDWANPQVKKSHIEGVSADVAAVVKGYKESVETVGSNRVGDIF